ncbi:hypothetical protein WI70_13345 [Burkholderia cepacia]|nr:hypothetical protein WI47_17310 [Burkholderia cepacia]KVC22263.1 hypothetical protein WI70_13345 [Burkholderia cepacia]
MSELVLLALLKKDTVEPVLHLVAQHQLGEACGGMGKFEEPVKVSFGLTCQWSWTSEREPRAGKALGLLDHLLNVGGKLVVPLPGFLSGHLQGGSVETPIITIRVTS